MRSILTVTAAGGDLALLLRLTGNVTEACALDEQALARMEKRFTPNRHYSLAVAANMANDLSGLGEIEDARKLREATLERMRELFGDDYPFALTCVTNLSRDLRTVGDMESSTALAAQMMERCLALLGLCSALARWLRHRRNSVSAVVRRGLPRGTRKLSCRTANWPGVGTPGCVEAAAVVRQGQRDEIEQRAQL